MQGRLTDCYGAGFHTALEISCYSFIRRATLAEPLMREGGCLLTMSYLGAERVVEDYNLIGPIKAAPESAVRYLAAELGPQVNIESRRRPSAGGGGRRTYRREGTMAELTKDEGVLEVLVLEFESHRLPRLLKLKEKVDDGRPLDDADIQFLEDFQRTASAYSVEQLIERHPEYEDLFSRAVDLYSEIVAAALRNEQGA